MPRRRPQQLKGRGRRTSMYTKGRAPQPNPSWKQMKAAQTIQKYQRGRRARAALQYNVEMHQWSLEGYQTSMSHNGASAVLGPKNTKIFLPAGFHEDTLNQAANGVWMCPKFLKSKLTVSFDNLAVHADTHGLTARLYHGRVKITLAKVGAGATMNNQAAFAAECLTIIKRELFDSEYSSDFLDFKQKNRNIKIDGKWNIVPNQNQIAHASGSWVAPMKHYNVQHVVPKIKTRVELGTLDHKPLLMNLWIPFIAVSCDTLTANTGTLDIGHSSKLYYTDM